MQVQKQATVNVAQTILWGIIMLAIIAMMILWMVTSDWLSGAPLFSPVQDPIGFVLNIAAL